jgi:hypothetical protein
MERKENARGVIYVLYICGFYIAGNHNSFHLLYHSKELPVGCPAGSGLCFLRHVWHPLYGVYPFYNHHDVLSDEKNGRLRGKRGAEALSCVDVAA